MLPTKNNFSSCQTKKKNQKRKFLPQNHSANNVLLTNTKKTALTSLSTKVTEVIIIPLYSAVYSFGAIKENARIRNEQDADPLLKALKLPIRHEEFDKLFLKTKSRGRNLFRHEERSIMKHGVLMRKDYGEDGSVTHNQVIIPKHIVYELLSTLHGKTNKHPGITKMIQECRAKYYFRGLH